MAKENIKIYGVKGCVYLNSSESLKIVASKLSDGLIIPDFRIENNEEPPYELIGLAELLGFELWLEKSNKIKGYNYEIRIETSHSLSESFNNKMYDISPWLARYIFEICDIGSCICSNNNEYYAYKNSDFTLIT